MNREDGVAIVVAYGHEAKDHPFLSHICWGIEEEGIPYVVEEITLPDAVSLAKEGTRRSKLGISVALDGKGIGCLDQGNFRGEDVLFLKTLETEEEARALGTNGARLMKGIPFK